MNGTATPVATDDYLVRALGDFIRQCMDPGLLVIRGYVNRVSRPAGPRYALVTPMGAVRLATNLRDWNAEDGTETLTMPARRSVQIDFFGADADSLALTASILLRDPAGCDFLAPYGVAPLHAEDPRDLTAQDGREQWAKRWMVSVMLQANATSRIGLDYFTNVNLSLHPQA